MGRAGKQERLTATVVATVHSRLLACFQMGLEAEEAGIPTGCKREGQVPSEHLFQTRTEQAEVYYCLFLGQSKPRSITACSYRKQRGPRKK